MKTQRHSSTIVLFEETLTLTTHRDKKKASGYLSAFGPFALAAALLPAIAGAALTVQKGNAPDQYVLIGLIATPDGIVDGKVVITGDSITCVGADCADPPNVTQIQVSDAYILPGFVDAHNHVAYNVFPKWQPPKRYQNRSQWQASKAYKTFKAPYNALKAGVYCEMVKYGEVKALVSGITTIQGTSPNRTCFSGLVRNAENQNELGIPGNYNRTYILDIKSFKGSVNWGQTHSFVVHVAEGIDEKSNKEFATLKQKGLLHTETAVIHGTAFGETEFAAMAALGAKLIWSPQSNLALYGKTTDIKTAYRQGVKISLGVDWNPTGSDNIFNELRVAAKVNQEMFGSAIPDSEWLKLITQNPAEALGLQDYVGRIAPHQKADVTIVESRDSTIEASLLRNQIQDVQLVFVNGTPLYGDQVAMQALRPNECEDLTVKNMQKQVCMKNKQAGIPKSNQTFSDIVRILRARYANLAALDP